MSRMVFQAYYICWRMYNKNTMDGYIYELRGLFKENIKELEAEL